MKRVVSFSGVLVLALACGLLIYCGGSKKKSSDCSSSGNFCSLPASCEKPVTFADPNLKAAVISALSLSGDTVYNQDFCSVYSLTLNGDSISSLVGLENAIDAERIDLGNNFISDLSPLSNLSNLVSIVLGNNSISDLSPLATLSYLGSIDLGNNSVSDLSPLANLSYLQSLLLSSNNISSISSLSNLNALVILDLGYNTVTDISPLAGLKNLETLYLDGNAGLSDITVLSGLHKLQNLYLDGDPLDQPSCCTCIPDLVDCWSVTVDDGGYCVANYTCSPYTCL